MREPCQQLRRRHAFMLLFVLVFIVLATTLVLLTAAGTAQFARSARSERTSLLLRQMIDSGIAWSRTNRGTGSETTSEPQPRTIVLDAADLVPSPGTGEIRLTYLNVAPPAVIVEAVFERDNKRHRSSAQVTLKSADR
ncbi:MAG: hypothetical protein IH987_14225 [Planctomycetes bacterium]|nr:hypothetical protein [Planctomycetota bacterium]